MERKPATKAQQKRYRVHTEAQEIIARLMKEYKTGAASVTWGELLKLGASANVAARELEETTDLGF